MARFLYGCYDGGLGNLVEHNAGSVLPIQSEHFTQVPGDSLSLAVLIAGEPYLVGLGSSIAQLLYQTFFLLWHLIVGYKRVSINAVFFFLQVTDVSVARHHFIIFAKKPLNGFGFCGALYDN